MSSEDVPVAASIRDRIAVALLRAMKERDTVAVAALRSALAEIANAEAVPFTGDGAPVTGSQHVAGAAAGLRAVEVDPDRRDALLWNFTMLGEAVGQLSDETKASEPEIGWAHPARMTNRIVHAYWSADLEVLVSTAHYDLPAFVDGVRAIREALTEGP